MGGEGGGGVWRVRRVRAKERERERERENGGGRATERRVEMNFEEGGRRMEAEEEGPSGRAYPSPRSPGERFNYNNHNVTVPGILCPIERSDLSHGRG